MLKVSRLLRDHERAGSVNSLLAPWGFVDDRTFLTKAGHLGVAYRINGADYECLDTTQRRDVVHRFEAALKLLGEPFRVYQYLSKKRIAPLERRPLPTARRARGRSATRRLSEWPSTRAV